eukprot:7153520-Pyramimonas_sp.AAC.1
MSSVRKELAGELAFDKVLTVNFTVSVKNWRENWLNKVVTVNFTVSVKNWRENWLNKVLTVNFAGGDAEVEGAVEQVRIGGEDSYSAVLQCSTVQYSAVQRSAAQRN